MADGNEMQVDQAVLQKQSPFFDALLSSGMKETSTKRIELMHLPAPAVEWAIRILERSGSIEEQLPWPGFEWERDGISLLHVLDYFQMMDKHDDKATLSSIRILYQPQIIEEELVNQGYVTPEGNVVALPVGKKKRSWRFWTCFVLCRRLLPTENQQVDQVTFTATLSQACLGEDPIALRRELVEYGLISREGDGSAYWRPTYTVPMVRQWLAGMPRLVI
jgi:hypothetical protein